MNQISKTGAKAAELAKAGASVTAENLQGIGVPAQDAAAFVHWLNSPSGATVRAQLKSRTAKGRKRIANPPKKARRDVSWSVMAGYGRKVGNRSLKGICK